jgi:predicted CoA-binding protein
MKSPIDPNAQEEEVFEFPRYKEVDGEQVKVGSIFHTRAEIEKIIDEAQEKLDAMDNSK